MRYPVLLAAACAAACSPLAVDTQPPTSSPEAGAVAADARSYEARTQARARKEAAIAAGLKPITGGPDKAMEWRLLRWRDENGVFDPTSVERAREQRHANAEYHASIDDAGIGRYGWVEKGPNNIGGRTRSLVINPANTSEMWAGSVGGGVWRSTNSGTSWAPVNDRMSNLAVCSLALVPGTPVTLYAGTGEGIYNGDAIAGNGIYKSTDGGATFTRLASTSTWSYVNRIAVSPANPQILLAATRSPGGIYRSTNGGTSWVQVRSATACMQVLFDPNDVNKCVADVYEGGVHRVVHSTNAGVAWSNAASGLVSQSGLSGRIELCYAPSVANMVYASCGTNGGLIWRSTDGGVNWTQQTTGSGSGAAWYYNALWVDPTDANFLVTGAYHTYKSVDGGVTLSQISNGYINTSQPHPDCHGYIADPGFNGTTNRRVYAVNDGGIYTAADIRSATMSTGWSRREQSYRASQFYGAAGDGATGRITGGTQDNGHLTIQNGSTTASLTFGGDGGFAAIDWQNPNYIYGEYVNAQVHRSTNGGTSASYIDGGISEAGSAANFIAPILLDPNDPRRLLVGAASLWRTNDARAASVAWTSIKPSVGSNIAAIAVAQGNAAVIWIGHNDGRIYKTANGTAAAPTWTAVDDNGALDPLPNRYLTRLAIDPTNNNVVWATFGGFASGNVRVTRDGGATWNDASGTGARRLPDVPVNCIVLHPDDPNVLYAGTEVGVFASDDAGAHWSANNDGPNQAPVEQVVFEQGSRKLIAATLGRGLWTCLVQRPSVTAFGTACAGHTTPPVVDLDPLAPARIGQTMRWTGSNLLGNAFGFLAIGLSDTAWSGGSLPTDLGFVGMPGCPLQVSPDVTSLAFADASGNAQVLVGLPASTGLIGTVLFGQWLAQDPPRNAAGFAVSAGLRVVVGQ